MKIRINHNIINNSISIAVFLYAQLIWMCPFEISAKTGSFDYTVVLDSSQLYETTEVGGDGETYSRFHWNGMISDGTPGAPELPVKYLKFFVPTYCKNISVNLKTSNASIILETKYRPYPAQEPQMADGTEIIWTAPEKEFYNPSAISPSLTVCGESFLDGFNHVVTIAVHPVVYSDSYGTLTAYDDISFSISYEECGEKDMKTKPIIPKQYRPYFSLDNSIIDPLGIRKSNERRYASASSTTAATAGYYYVIVPENLKDAMSDFVTWKSQKGYKVELITIDSILTMPNFRVDPTKTVNENVLVDEAACLRAYLTREFIKNGFFHCLLIGNYKTSMPIRKLVSSHSPVEEKNDFAERLVPSNLYFTDLSYNYKLALRNKLSIYTSMLPETFSKDITLGRLLCSNPEEIENWFYKLRLYEANPGYGDNNYLGNTLFFEQHSTTGGSLIDESMGVRRLLSSYFDSIIYMPDNSFFDATKDGPTGAEVIKEISKVGLSHWYGHGNPAGIAVSKGDFYITSEDSVYNVIYNHSTNIKDEEGNGVNNLTNVNKPSVVYSTSCENTPFDYIMTSYGKSWECQYNLGEAFTVANKKIGGPLFLGNTRKVFIGPSSFMAWSFFKDILNNRQVGYAENNSKDYKENDDASSLQRVAHSIIGDPEMELWIGKPKELEIELNYVNKKVYLQGGQLSGSKVCFYDGMGHSASYDVSSNDICLSLQDISGEFDMKSIAVSVWKSGFLPVIKFLGQCSTENGNKNFIVRDADLGHSPLAGIHEDYIIGSGGHLVVKAIDKITAHDGLKVENGGIAELECDNDIFLEGGTVKSGGTLKVNGKKIVMGKKFTVEKGGKLILTTSN